MRRNTLRLFPLLLALVAAAPVAIAQSGPAPDPALRAAFVAEAGSKYGLEASEVESWLAKSNHRQSIVAAMSRPAEKVKPWREYRPIFISDRRIAEGQAFLSRHRDELAKVEATTGVPAEVIVAIIGVETSYGGNTGSYAVLDALYTLGFFYPASGDPAQLEREAARGRFFRDELMQVMLLAKEEKLDLAALKGSYAGAMGYGQFMPSSYRAYARDGDGDGRRDLFNELPDVFASIANYFVAHGWQRDEPVVALAQAEDGAAPFVPDTLEAKYSLAELGEKGYRPALAQGHDLKATLVTFEGSAGTEYWLGFRNFYAITRYNRSPMYAMAVYQLSREIAAGAEAATAP